jgi:NhaP-type Na+/H+ or K+/H+ antiporter
MYQNLAVLAVFVYVYSILAGKLERLPIGGPILWVAFGLLVGPVGLGFLVLDIDAEGLLRLAEITLAVILFTDAANADLKELGRSLHIPRRLLLIGLPLTILAGFGTGYLLFAGIGLFELAILSTMLAPTDAALGKAVVSNKAVPSDVREGLNVESGLNDGICVPVLFVFLELAAGAAGEGSTTGLVVGHLVEELGIGLAVGLGLTAIGAWIFRFAAIREWVSDHWAQIPVIMLALASFAIAQSLGGSGFIAAFTGGLLFGSMAKTRKHDLLRAAEATGDTLSLFTWVVFGAAVVGPALGLFTWPVLVYAILSLTLVRMVPVFLSLIGLGMRNDAKLFIGWFGPRGLASIVFAVIVVGAQLPGGETLTLTVVATVLLSVIGHGLTAQPLATAFGARAKKEN